MTGLMSILQKWHNSVILPTDYDNKLDTTKEQYVNGTIIPELVNLFLQLSGTFTFKFWHTSMGL